MSVRPRSRLRGLGLSLLAGAAAVVLSAGTASAESRSYVVSWFTQATYSQEDDCPGGTNPVIEEQWRRDLVDMGKTQAEADEIVKSLGDNTYAAAAMDQIINRGRIDGKPVSAYANPASVKDPHMKTVVSKYAIGFNLDGKGAASPNSFEDPITHEAGVNNELARALGCIHTFRGRPPERSSNWELWWGLLRDSMPAWLITISGADLSKDGDVTLTFDRALEHSSKDVNSQTRPDMTYRIDADSRSHNVFKAKLKDGILTTVEPASFNMVGDVLVFPKFEMHRTHMRIGMKPEGGLDGIVGGYEPWIDVYYGLAFGGYAVESNLGADMPGMYHLFKHLADADPDPKSGQNRSISAAWRIEAVPAFVVPVETGKTAQAGATIQTSQTP